MIFTARRVWDGVAEAPIIDGFVRTSGAWIEAVGRCSDLDRAAATVDLGDVTMMPGFIDGHVHMTLSGADDPVGDFLRERDEGTAVLRRRAERNLAAALDVGVTTVRDLGTPNDVAFEVRSAVRARAIRGPDVFAAGEGITSPGGHCHFFGIEVSGEDGVRGAVSRQHRAGADLIKIFATGGNITPGSDARDVQFSAAELEAAVDAANGYGMHVAAHAHAPEGIRRSVAAGAATIEHCSFDGHDGLGYDERVVASMAAEGVAVVPTLGQSLLRYLADPTLLDRLEPELRRRAQRRTAMAPALLRNYERMHVAGVDVVAGTDAGIVQRPFGSFPDELALLARAPDDGGIGLGAMGALRAATSQAARVLGLDDRGVIAPGKRADLVAVDGDPFADITTAERVRAVVAAGVIDERP